MGFAERFPRWITAIMGIAQTVLTAAIFGLEVASVNVDLVHGTIWAGFWCSIVFVPTCFMMILITCCCCRDRCCATYVLILNVASGALSWVLIHFDAYFINNLCKCYLGDQLCCAIRGISSFNSDYGTIAKNCTASLLSSTASTLTCPVYPLGKLIYLQAQLRCAVGMLTICVLYIVLYIFACGGICFGHSYKNIKMKARDDKSSSLRSNDDFYLTENNSNHDSQNNNKNDPPKQVAPI